MDWKLSYDYEDLLNELKSDAAEFDYKEDDVLYIVRGKHIVHTHFIAETTQAYYPIIDYYFSDDEIDEPVKESTVGEVLAEMERMHSIM